MKKDEIPQEIPNKEDFSTIVIIHFMSNYLSKRWKPKVITEMIRNYERIP